MIVVTGASGNLGKLVVEQLLEVVAPSEIVAVGRDADKLKRLADRGVVVREVDYSRPETLQGLFHAGDKLLLVSSSEVGQRVKQHTAVVDAAKTTGVRSIAYTSLLRADTTTLALAPEHKETEAYIRNSGLTFTFLRNGWYLENHTENLAPALQHGAIIGSAGEGRFASASRVDYAAAAVAVLTGTGHENKVYELAGDRSFTLTELAALVSKSSGKPVVYKDLPPDAYKGALEGFGIPAGFAGILVDSDLGAAKGELDSHSGDLRTLIGRATTTVEIAVAAAVQQ